MVRAVWGGEDIYEERSDRGISPRFSASRSGGRQITRELIVPGIGGVELLIGECFPAYRPPGQYPTGAAYFVDDLDIQPFGKAKGLTAAGITEHEAYKAVIVYRTLDYDTQQEDSNNPGVANPLQNVTVSTEVGGDYQIIPGGHLFWEDGKRIEESVATGVIYKPETRYTVTKHHAQYFEIPFAKMKSMRGRVNATNFGANHFAFPDARAGTVLYLTGSWNRSTNSFGQHEYTYSLHFIEMARELNGQQYGWNHFFDPASQTFREVYLKPDGNASDRPYQTFTDADLRELLKYA